MLEIISYMTYFSPAVSPAMWELWPLMVGALQDWALQYFENVLVPLDNYISRGTETFLAHPAAKEDVLKLASLLLLDKDMPEAECLPAPKLMECVLLNCKGRVDDCVAPYLAVALERLGVCQLSYLQDLLVQVLANCLYYNSVLTLGVLASNGRTTQVLSHWFTMLAARTRSGKRKHHRREHDKKVCALGLLALLQVPTESLPADIAAGLGGITATLVSLLADLKVQIAERKEEEENDDGRGGWSDDDEDIGDEELGEEDDEGEEEGDEEAIQRLAARARKVNPFNAGRHGHLDGEGESDDDSEDEGMLTDDDNVTSPIDDVDPFISFAQVIQQTHSTDAARFGALTAAGRGRICSQDVVQTL